MRPTAKNIVRQAAPFPRRRRYFRSLHRRGLLLLLLLLLHGHPSVAPAGCCCVCALQEQ